MVCLFDLYFVVGEEPVLISEEIHMLNGLFSGDFNGEAGDFNMNDDRLER